MVEFGEAEGRAVNHGLNGVGHRVVHGGDSFESFALIDDGVVSDVIALEDLAPLHNAAAMECIEAAHDVGSCCLGNFYAADKRTRALTKEGPLANESANQTFQGLRNPNRASL